MSKKCFSNEKEAKEYLLESMEKKYNQSFEVIDSEKYETVNGVNIYTSKVQVKGDKSKTSESRVTDYGELTDDYAKNYFEKDAEEVASKICKTKNYIQKFEVNFDAPWTKDKLDKDLSLEEYIKKSDAYNEVTIYLKDGLTNEEYANQIENMLTDLYKSSVGSDLRVNANGMEIFGEKFSGNEAEKKLSHKEIIENIESCISNYKMLH